MFVKTLISSGLDVSRMEKLPFIRDEMYLGKYECGSTKYEIRMKFMILDLRYYIYTFKIQ